MTLLALFLVLFVAGARAAPASGSGYCSIFPQDLSEIPPLVLSSEPDGDFLYSYSPNGEIKVGVGETIRLACTKKPEEATLNLLSFRFYDNPKLPPFIKRINKETIIIKCVGNKSFIQMTEVATNPKKKDPKNAKPSTLALEPTGNPTEFKNFICDGPNSAIIIPERTGRKCGNSNDVKEIVFKLPSGQVYGIIDYCMIRTNPVKQYTAWAHAKIRPYISYNFVAPRGQPIWTNFDATNSVWEQDLFKSQEKNTVLENWKRTASDRINRGHLIAYTDMYWPSQRNGTFDYVNAVPQWESINSGNWEAVEKIVRGIATEKGRELDVWVGGVGTMGEGSKKELYLKNEIKPKSSAKFKNVPVPAYLYKLVLDKSTNEGIVFVTIHNPFINISDAQALVKCKDVSDGIAKMNRAKNRNWSNTNRGYTFCCTIEDFRSKFSNEPVGITLRPTTLIKFT